MGPHRCGHCGRVLFEPRRFCDSLCEAEAAGRRVGWRTAAAAVAVRLRRAR